MKLADIKKEFEQYIILKDEHVLNVLFACIVGNLYVDRDPLWLMLVAPSSGGKTVIIGPLVNTPDAHFIDDLTEKTLLSGFKIKGKETSLLKIIQSGNMCFSDFTAILAKNKMSRGEILGQLRLVFDGNFVKQTGTGKIEWKGKIGCIAGCTPDIYSFLEEARSAGERFIYYWMEQPTDDEIVDKQQQVQMSSREITKRMQVLYDEYIKEQRDWIRARPDIELKMTPAQAYQVRRAAIFCVNGKTTVRTDYKTGKPDAIPNKAGVGRDAKMFDALLLGLQIQNCYEHDDPDLPVTDDMVRIVEKCAYSAINRERRKILEILVASDTPLSGSEIGAKEGLGLEKESVEKYLMPLHSVGLIKKKKVGNTFRWFIEDEDTKDFVKRVSATVVDNTHVEGIENPVDEDDSPDDSWADEFMNGPDLPQDEGL